MADVCDTARLAPLLAGMDAIVHTASLHVPDLAASSAGEFRAVNVDATRRLLAAAGEAGIARFVYTSTTSLYGDAMLPTAGEAAWVSEELAPRPRDVYDETKLAAEEACREAARHGLACTSLRMSRCFPEEPRLVALYRLYRGVDAEDVAQAHELALATGRTGYEVYNVSAPSPFARADCRRLFEDAASVVLERYPWAEAEFQRRGWLSATVHRPCLCGGQGDRRAGLPTRARFCGAVPAEITDGSRLARICTLRAHDAAGRAARTHALRGRSRWPRGPALLQGLPRRGRAA